MRHFNISEFDCKSSPGTGKNMKPIVLEKLDNARGLAGIPFVINSGYRTVRHNAKVGGSPTSSHLYGWAVDIDCDVPSNRLKIVRALLQVGFKRIGVAEGFIHVDDDPGKPAAMWIY